MNPFWVVLGPKRREAHRVSTAAELRALDPVRIGGIACAEDIAELGRAELARLATEVHILRTVWPEIRFRAST